MAKSHGCVSKIEPDTKISNLNWISHFLGNAQMMLLPLIETSSDFWKNIAPFSGASGSCTAYCTYKWCRTNLTSGSVKSESLNKLS